MKQTVRTILFLLSVTGLFLLSLFIKTPEKKSAPAVSESKSVERPAYAKKIFVPNEWAPLKETVLGTPLMLTHLVCDDEKKTANAESDAARKPSDDAERFCRIKTVEESAPDFYEQLAAELKNLENVLTENGVRVSLHNPEILSDEELFYRRDINRGVNFLQARKPVLIVGDTVMETASSSDMLSGKFSLRRILSFLMQMDGEAVLISMPEPSPQYPPDGIYLDSSNVLVDGRDVYVGTVGGQENKGALWLKNVLKKTHRVHAVSLKEGRFLDDVLAFIGPKTLIMEKDAFFDTLPDSLKNHRKIEISAQDNTFGLSDMLILNPKKIVLNEKNEFLKNLLQREGFETIGLPLDALVQTKTTLREVYHPIKRAVE